jgi:hypothetical protein
VGDHLIERRQDKKNSISSKVGLTWHQGRLGVVVESADTKAQISALLDVLDLRQSGVHQSPDGVAILLDRPSPEAVAAIATLRSVVADKVNIEVLAFDNLSWTPIADSAFDLSDAASYYPLWAGYLGAEFAVPPFLRALVRDVRRADLRAYPLLTEKGWWSLRLEGLEVGVVSADWARLGVGKIGKLGDLSRERTAWIAAVGTDHTIEVPRPDTAPAVDVIRAFAEQWAGVPDGQNEHVLESRILRGAVKIAPGGTSLSLIRDDDVVNWGSQFPTKWGPRRGARYLDALLREGEVPWAIEMKVNRGEGQYYRHAVAQAVLYREFIRQATSLHFWFEKFGLDATRCRAAVVVPTIGSPVFGDRLRALCDLFDVALVTVDPADTMWR